MEKHRESVAPAKQGDARSPGGVATGPSPEAPARDPILTLQRQIGNRAVGRILDGGDLQASSAPPVQAKLTVGRTDDPLEHEADAVADRVMRAPDHDLAISPDGEGIRRTCASCGGDAGHTGHKCAACEEEELHAKGASGFHGGGAAPASAHKALGSTGQPLDAGTRAFFEPRFGYDFSGVRVHTGDDAAQSAREIGARAYTAGSSIVFAEGQHSTSSPEGKRLLAHELAHVVQQGKAKRDSDVVRRAPWGKCPEGPRRSAAHPFIYGAAELYAVGQYMAQNAGHCMLTNTMLAANIKPHCRGEDADMVNALFDDFHHGHETRKKSVAPADNVTRRPESKSGALIEEGVDTVKALQQPDIIDVSEQEVYDVTTIGQRNAKVRKFRSRYLPVLSAITRRTWTAGTRMKPVRPLTSRLPKLGTLCFGQTDFDRWPGVIQYEVIKPEDTKDDKKKKKKSKKEEEDEKKKKKGEKEEEEKKKKKSSKEGEEEEGKKKKKGQKEGEEEKKPDVPGGNVGFGISILSSGGGKGNAVLGVSINSHGSAYGTASAGIIYDANGDAVGAASVGAGAHVSGHMAGGATAGVASHTSTEAAAVATAGKGKNTDTIALANASAGSAENTSTVTIATASSGEAKDIDDTAVAKKGSGSGSGQAGSGGGKPGEREGADTSDPTAGLQIPGVSKTETAKAVADAARIDAELQKASAAQKELLIYLAQQSSDLELEVPDPQWVLTFITATKGLSEADIKFLQQQNWVPNDKTTPQELRKQIDDRLKNRNKPQGTAKTPGGTHDTGKDVPPPKHVKPDDKGSSGDPKKPEKKITAASLDEPTTDPKKRETDEEAARRLYKRAKEFNWKTLKVGTGELYFGKEGRVYGQVSGQIYFKGNKGIGLTADVSGILTKGDKDDLLEVRTCSIIVTTDGRAIAASELVGQTLPFKR